MTLTQAKRRIAVMLRKPLALLRDCDGGALAVTAVLLPTIIGFAGLGVDLTHWYSQRRAMQNMADGAAIAATHAVMSGGTAADVQNAAVEGAIRNGWSAAQGYTVQTFAPPTAGLYPGLNRAAEVRISRNVPLYFLGAVGVDPVEVSARATGAGVDNGPQCVIALDHDADRAITFTGDAHVTLGCGIASNSSSNRSIYIAGEAILEANPAQAYGDIYIGNNATLVTQSPVQPYSQRVDDPYADVIMPVDPATCTETDFWAQTGETYVSPALQPGRYCNGLRINGTVDLDPGIYIVADGDFEVGSEAVLTGDEVTIVLTGATPGSVGNVKINGGAEITLTPTTTGEMAGILFYQDPNAAPGTSSIIESKFNGEAQVDLTGALYFPQRQVDYGGGASAAGASCLHIVARTVEFTGEANITNDPATCAAFGLQEVNQLRVQLVE
ncbi:pilus assembly protein TadG-related protein [Pelagibius marinus]|uniref:pilus assembly protein TadG-related protein n=1 Tax=Pelagibius marinus TaxID=2762760 RepID=UPI00187238D3|nr:pilus assembly protein TadG-related protein [Pelagibius marinus]